jgi:hypothetical protein
MYTYSAHGGHIPVPTAYLPLKTYVRMLRQSELTTINKATKSSQEKSCRNAWVWVASRTRWPLLDFRASWRTEKSPMAAGMAKAMERNYPCICCHFFKAKDHCVGPTKEMMVRSQLREPERRNQLRRCLVGRGTWPTFGWKSPLASLTFGINLSQEELFLNKSEASWINAPISSKWGVGAGHGLGVDVLA